MLETIITEESNVSREPKAKGEAPQTVYDKKKTIFRFDQVVWYILGLIEILLVFRVLLKALGANSMAAFTGMIYSLTNPLVSPFKGILGVFVTGNSIVEWSTIIAGVVYLCIAWGVIYLMNLIYPITPKDTGGGD